MHKKITFYWTDLILLLVATTLDLAKINTLLSNTDVIELCARERANTKWKIHKLKNDTVCGALLKEDPISCKDTTLPGPLLKNPSVNCLKVKGSTRKLYNDNLCLFIALALHLQGNERLNEETSNLLNLLLEKTVGIDPANFRCVCVEDIEIVHDIVRADIFLNDLSIVDESMIGNLASRSVGRHSNTVRLLRYTSHICYVTNTNAFVNVKTYRCPSSDQFIKRARHLEQHLTTCKKRVDMFFQGMRINCEKHCLTN